MRPTDAARLRAGPITVAALATAALLACGGSGDNGITNSRPKGPLSVAVVGARSSADTIDATSSTLLVVEVRSATGALVPDTGVLLTAPAPASGGQPPLLIVHPATQLAVPQVLARTDAAGRASLTIVNGQRVGTYYVTVAIQGAAPSDSASYEVRAGKPTRIHVGPRDTAAYVGHPYPLHIFLADRLGDSAGTPTIVTRRPSIGTRGDDGIYHPLAIGRAYIAATAIGFAPDSAAISVVPPGTLSTTSTVVNPKVPYFYALDGSVIQRVPWPDSLAGEIPLAWAADGSHALFNWRSLNALNPTDGGVFRIDGQGHVTQLAHGGLGYVLAQPRYSGDGACIYFLRSSTTDGQNQVWRMLPDGSGQAQISTAAFGWAPGQVTTSPDGALLAFEVGDGLTGASVVRVYELATQTLRSFTVYGGRPRWSPTSGEIAYLLGGIKFITPDGAPSGSVSSIDGDFYSLAWSADGKYLLTCLADSRIAVVDRASGEVMPLAFTYWHCDASWKP